MLKQLYLYDYLFVSYSKTTLLRIDISDITYYKRIIRVEHIV